MNPEATAAIGTSKGAVPMVERRMSPNCFEEAATRCQARRHPGRWPASSSLHAVAAFVAWARFGDYQLQTQRRCPTAGTKGPSRRAHMCRYGQGGRAELAQTVKKLSVCHRDLTGDMLRSRGVKKERWALHSLERE